MMMRSLFSLWSILLLSGVPILGMVEEGRSQAPAPPQKNERAEIDRLIQLLRSGISRVRLNAAFDLELIGAAAIPQLIPLLKDPDPKVSRSAIYILGRMGASAQSVIPQLILLLQDPNPDVRGNAAETLGLLGEAATVAIPQLIPLLQDPDSSVRASAAAALKQLGVP